MADSPPPIERSDTVKTPVSGPNAAGKMWPQFFKNLVGILFRPSATWTRLAEESPPVGRVMWPHVLVLVIVRAVAEGAGALLSDQGFGEALKLSILSFGTWLALVWLFATVALTIASARQGKSQFGDALRFSAFGITPFLVFGILSAIPMPQVATVADAVALPWAFYVLSVGVVPQLKVPIERAPGAVGLLTGALTVGGLVLPAALRLALASLGKA